MRIRISILPHIICCGICMFLFHACQPTKNTAEDLVAIDTTISKNRWYVVALNGEEIHTVNGKRPHLQFSSEESINGYTGCNQFSGTIETFTKNTIALAPLATTKMFCENNEMETKMLNALAKIQTWRIEAGQLLLSSNDTVTLKLKGVSHALAKLEGTWELNYITGKRITFDSLYPDKKPYFSFDVATNQIGGNTTCNGFSATYTMEGDAIQFNDPLKTMMFCEDGGETSFLDMLKKTTHYELKNDTLTFRFANSDAMKFHKL